MRRGPGNRVAKECVVFTYAARPGKGYQVLGSDVEKSNHNNHLIKGRLSFLKRWCILGMIRPLVGMKMTCHRIKKKCRTVLLGRDRTDSGKTGYTRCIKGKCSSDKVGKVYEVHGRRWGRSGRGRNVRRGKLQCDANRRQETNGARATASEPLWSCTKSK